MADSAIRVAVAGAGGRMGQEVVRSVMGQSDMRLVGAFDIPALEGQDSGQLATGRTNGVALVASIDTLLLTRPEVLVDFTRFDTAPHHLRAALQQGVAAVVGTTGMGSAVLDELGEVATQRGTGCFVAPNFSVGAVLMMIFARQAARYYEAAEVIEMHHDKKLDAPSGTAMRTVDMMMESRGKPFSPALTETMKLEGARGGLQDGVHIHSVRLPGYLAHQEVMFGGDGEVLTLRHDSTNRTCFMPGVMLSIRKARGLRGLVVGLEKLMEAG